MSRVTKIIILAILIGCNPIGISGWMMWGWWGLSVGLYISYRRNMGKNWWWVIPIVVLINLIINRLLYVNGLDISFDSEQSFWGYLPIQRAIERYRLEGLWLIYSARNWFYAGWMMILPWINSVLDIWSMGNWLRVYGWTMMWLVAVGIKTGRVRKWQWWWLLVVTVTSGLRIWGDRATALLLTSPVIVEVAWAGLSRVKKYGYWWLGLIILDLIL